MKSLKYLLVLSVIVLFSACTKEKTPYFEAILKSEKGLFRGVEMSTTMEEVKSLEDEAFLVDDMGDYLYYDFIVDTVNSFTVSYDFYENLLYEIEMAAFFKSVDDAKDLFNNFEDYFDHKYGKGKLAEDGYTSWMTKSVKTGNKIEIAMIDESNNYGAVTILISDLDY